MGRTKLRWNVAGSAAFVALGVVFLVVPMPIRTLFRVLVGGAAIAFFGLTLGFGVKRLLATPPGLTLTPEGMVDTSNGLAIGEVRWSDVSNIIVSSIFGTPFLVVQVRDPALYLARGNALQRWSKRTNQKMVGSPITIGATALEISFDELSRLVLQYFETYGGSPPPTPGPSAAA